MLSEIDILIIEFEWVLILATYINCKNLITHFMVLKKTAIWLDPLLELKKKKDYAMVFTITSQKDNFHFKWRLCTSIYKELGSEE